LDIDYVEIGTEGSFVGPVDKGIESIKKLEAIGYDSVWFADHLMGWTPDSIWTKDLIPLAAFPYSPNDFYELFSMLSLAGWNTTKIRMGSGVTEVFRRHPAQLAQAFITQDNISKGRTILGIGAGEGENVIPYGIKWEKPVSRLEEALKIIRLLWESDKKIDYNGEFWKLKDAILSIKPFTKNKYPPIWIGAHGPRMCEITGRLGDGWIPTNLTVETYKEKLAIIKDSAKKAGRDLEDFTPALWRNLIIDEDHNACDELLKTPYAKNFALILPNSNFEQYGTKHPFGEGFHGMLEYVPTRYDRESMLEAINKIPDALCDDIFLHGTPDEVIKQIEDYAKVGLKHIILWNMTFASDLSKIKSSFRGLKKVLEYFKDLREK